MYEFSYFTKLKKAEVEIKNLKKEIEQLKEDLLYNRMYLYVVDSDADCFPKKDDVDAWTDDPQERKTLYKRIYYESDGDDEDDEEEE